MYTNTVYKDSIKKQKLKYLIFPVFPCTLGIIRNLFVDLLIYLNLFSKPSVIFSDILKLVFVVFDEGYKQDKRFCQQLSSQCHRVSGTFVSCAVKLHWQFLWKQFKLQERKWLRHRCRLSATMSVTRQYYHCDGNIRPFMFTPNNETETYLAGLRSTPRSVLKGFVIFIIPLKKIIVIFFFYKRDL